MYVNVINLKRNSGSASILRNLPEKKTLHSALVKCFRHFVFVLCHYGTVTRIHRNTTLEKYFTPLSNAYLDPFLYLDGVSQNMKAIKVKFFRLPNP